MLAVAWQRVDEFIRIEGNFLVLDASARELNFSDELFSFIKAGIEGQNRIISTRAVAIPDETLPFDGYGNNNPSGGGGGGLTYTAGFGYYQLSATLNHDEAIQFFHTMQNIGTQIGGATTLSGLLGFVKSISNIVTFQCIVMGAYSYFTGVQWSSYETQYLNGGSNNGVTIVQTTFTASTIPYTAYSIIPLQ
jgi:hypothetical protein